MLFYSKRSMNYLEFGIRLLAFAVTLFLLLEFIVACDTDTWKAAGLFCITAFLIIGAFFLTKQHILIKCTSCGFKMSPVRSTISNVIN